MSDHSSKYADADREWKLAVANLIPCSDTNALWSNLFGALSNYLNISSISLICYQRDKVPIILFADAHEDPERRRITAYLKGAYLLDPFYHACIEGLDDGLYRLDQLAPLDFSKSEYFRTFFSTFGLLDEINVIVKGVGGATLAVSLGRPKGGQAFDAESINRLAEEGPFLSNLLMRTWGQLFVNSNPQQSSANAAFHARLKGALELFGTSVLTAREKEVLDQLLRGHNVKSAALNMGVTPGTIRIHKHRIYEKLDIGSQTELFALILECLRQTTDNTDEDPLKKLLPPDC